MNAVLPEGSEEDEDTDQEEPLNRNNDNYYSDAESDCSSLPRSISPDTGNALADIDNYVSFFSVNLKNYL